MPQVNNGTGTMHYGRSAEGDDGSYVTWRQHIQDAADLAAALKARLDLVNPTLQSPRGMAATSAAFRHQGGFGAESLLTVRRRAATFASCSSWPCIQTRQALEFHR